MHFFATGNVERQALKRLIQQFDTAVGSDPFKDGIHILDIALRAEDQDAFPCLFDGLEEHVYVLIGLLFIQCIGYLFGDRFQQQAVVFIVEIASMVGLHYDGPDHLPSQHQRNPQEIPADHTHKAFILGAVINPLFRKQQSAFFGDNLRGERGVVVRFHRAGVFVHLVHQIGECDDIAAFIVHRDVKVCNVQHLGERFVNNMKEIVQAAFGIHSVGDFVQNPGYSLRLPDGAEVCSQGGKELFFGIGDRYNGDTMSMQFVPGIKETEFHMVLFCGRFFKELGQKLFFALAFCGQAHRIGKLGKAIFDIRSHNLVRSQSTQSFHSLIYQQDFEFFIQQHHPFSCLFKNASKQCFAFFQFLSDPVQTGNILHGNNHTFQVIFFIAGDIP